MRFNSPEFLVFLFACFFTYWFALKKTVRGQNLFLLAASYVFYGWWDYRFLALIIASTVVDYLVGLGFARVDQKRNRRWLLAVSIAFNLGLLGFFKYYNFFVESWIEAFRGVGIEMHASTLQIILPVGISFYTFQTLSYSIDAFRRKIETETNLINFAVFVAFFPQLVAGPIERASHLLPQFSRRRVFEYDKAVTGLSLIVWGLFKKVVVADNCAFFVKQIFENPQSYNSAELFLGVFLFSFQIYCDFSGYSDIAIGVARLFGFDLMTNFAFPYFSKNIADFWRRWHISLSTWFRDYVYIPIGGSHGSNLRKIRNVCVIFLVSGLWHGANWTFVVWGGIHAMMFLPLIWINTHRKYLNESHFALGDILKIAATFVMVTLAWIYFRADSLAVANQYLIDILSFNGTSLSIFTKSSKYILLTGISFGSIALLLVQEFFAYRKGLKEVRLSRSLMLFYVVVIIFLGVFKNQSEFIYFQF